MPRLRAFSAGLALLTAICLGSSDVRAQPEIVPAEHPVYDFLHQQRVRGHLPDYRHEARPLGRGRLGRLLDSLSARTDAGAALDPASADWLARYRRELFEPADAVETVIGPGGRVRLPLGAETEKFLYHYRDDDWRIALEAVGRVQFRFSDGEAAYHGAALTPEGIIQGNYRGIVGFYSGTFNGQQFGGDTRVLQADPDLAPLYYIGRQENPPGSFDRATASVRTASRVFFAEIAHERLLMGASFGDGLILTEGSDYFSFVRLGLETRVVQYQFLHAALGDRSFQAPGDEEGSTVLLGPERYLALHRLTLNPWRRLQLAFTEMVVYGQRGPELAYLNPINPIKPAEHALWDRDNTLFVLEATFRPLDGVEAYGTFLADDLDFGLLGKNSFNNKWAVQAGLGAALGPALGWVEYTRIEPFVYTHRFLLDGSFYNAYQHNGFGLGHPLGPNADQVEAGLRLWLPARLRAELRARYVRRGENYVDPETGELVNVGGDITDGRQPPFSDFSKVFLAGERFAGPGATLGLTWEPIRDYALNLLADYQRWDHAPDALFVRTELVVDL